MTIREGSAQKMSAPSQVSIRSLHIFALWGFAVAQPLYDLIGRNGAFLVAHRAGPATIVTLVLLLSLGLPALLLLVSEALARVRPGFGRGAHVSWIAILAALTASPLAIKLLPESLSPNLRDALVLAVAVEAALIAAICYGKLPVVRRFCTLMSPAIVVFPGAFLFFTPVSGLVFPADAAATRKAVIETPVPIVMVVLDEMNTTVLLDENRRIDAVRYPNFAALAADGWWFPNATASHYKTELAVPAILTGKWPRDPKKLPAVEDHPNNLFTWLGGTLPLNVFETITELCPEELCGSKGPGFSADEFVRDLCVAYLHIVTPKGYAELIPPMGFGWRGFEFSSDRHRHGEVAAQVRRVIERGRHRQFDAFLQAIGDDEPALHFLHILLPHHPYQYLPSERIYSTSIAAEGLQVNYEWGDDETLIDTAYLQYMLQVGYVDTLLGKLLARLRSTDLYERALIIVTADHGIAFHPGKPYREILPETASDILPVPMFVKTPGQRAGRASGRRVSGVDIVPTIAEVLGTRPAWQVDGHSMVATDFPGRDSIDVLGVGRFPIAAVTEFDRLPWQIARFGTATAFDRIVSRSGFQSIIGEEVGNLEVPERASHLRVESESAGLFEQVDLDSGFIPSLFKGHVVAGDAAAAGLDLAVALNGVVRAATTTVQWDGKPGYFSVMLPEAAFRQGRNQIDVFRILDDTGTRRLARLKIDDRQAAKIERQATGEELLVFSDGRRATIGDGVIKGYLGHVKHQGSVMSLHGWAADMTEFHPVESVVLLSGSVAVGVTSTGVARIGLAEHYGREALRRSGFAMLIQTEDLPSELKDIRVIGVSEAGIAGDLEITPAAACVLRRVLGGGDSCE